MELFCSLYNKNRIVCDKVISQDVELTLEQYIALLLKQKVCIDIVVNNSLLFILLFFLAFPCSEDPTSSVPGLYFFTPPFISSSLLLLLPFSHNHSSYVALKKVSIQWLGSDFGCEDAQLGLGWGDYRCNAEKDSNMRMKEPYILCLNIYVFRSIQWWSNTSKLMTERR